MVVADFLPEERTAAETLRSKIAALKTNKDGIYDDGYILRWLRANNGDAEATEVALRKHLILRKAWGLNKEWTQEPEVLKKHYGYGFPGYDKEGSPILIETFGELDPEGLMKSCAVSNYIKRILHNLEEGVKRCREIAQKKKLPYEQILFIMDMQGMTTSHYTYKPFTNSYLTLVTLFQENYPLVFKKILVVRAPTMATYAYSLLSPFLGESIQQTVSLYGENWAEAVSEFADRSELPETCGGTKTQFEAKMNVCEKPVPENLFYSADLPEGMTSVTVYAGDKHITDYEVTAAGTKLSWVYKTSAEDIGFAIYYNPGGESTELADMVPLFPYVRLECHMVPESGSFICERPGIYVVEFDNHYSWFSVKELAYKITMEL